uniref:Uncharacterized protein n=1 Tax=Mycobacterium riyadhense TaxID=486698 RepID=A0A653ED74_9MYCO|nr:hypothetical protein BIN_B_00962 [Mycobacterium riyadhense]
MWVSVSQTCDMWLTFRFAFGRGLILGEVARPPPTVVSVELRHSAASPAWKT